MNRSAAARTPYSNDPDPTMEASVSSEEPLAASDEDAGTSEDAETYEVDGVRLRRAIAASWQRSFACGLNRSDSSDLPSSDDVSEETQLMRAARPVLDRL